MSVTLRAATPQDLAFFEHVFFTTQRWIIERLFGWRGDGYERRRLQRDHPLTDAQIIVVEGHDAGWLIQRKHSNGTEIDGIYILPDFQRKGIGGRILGTIIHDAETAHVP